MTDVEQETRWLRAWERGAKNYGWEITRRQYVPDEGTAEAYGFYFYTITKGKQGRTVKIGTLMMEQFAPSESVLYEGLDPEFI